MILRMMCLLIGLACGGAALTTMVETGLPSVVPEVAVVGQVELIPLTPFAEIIGATARRDVCSGAVTLTRGTPQFTCTPDDRRASDGKRTIILPLAPVEQGEVLYAPLRAVVSALGGEVAGNDDLTQGMARVQFPDHAAAYLFPRHKLGKLEELTEPTKEIYAAHPDGSGLRRLTYSLKTGTGYPGIYDLSLSPDGQSLLYSRDGSLLLHALNSHQETILIRAHGDNDYYVYESRFTPDGKGILFATSFGELGMYIMRMDLDGKNIHPVIPGCSDFIFLPDERGIAYVTDGSYPAGGDPGQPAMMFIADAEGITPRQLATGDPISFFRWFRSSQNGAVLAAILRTNYAAGNNAFTETNSVAIYVFTGPNAGTFYVTPAKKRAANYEELVDVSPDGRYILYFRQNIKHDYFLVCNDLTQERQVPVPSDMQNLRFSADGHHLLFERGDATFAMALDTFTVTPSPPEPTLLTKDGKYGLFLRAVQ